MVKQNVFSSLLRRFEVSELQYYNLSYRKENTLSIIQHKIQISYAKLKSLLYSKISLVTLRGERY